MQESFRTQPRRLSHTYDERIAKLAIPLRTNAPPVASSPSSGKASQTLEPLLSRMKDAPLRFPTQLDPVFHPLLSFRSLEE
jgi:hypothetical protein